MCESRVFNDRIIYGAIICLENNWFSYFQTDAIAFAEVLRGSVLSLDTFTTFLRIYVSVCKAYVLIYCKYCSWDKFSIYFSRSARLSLVSSFQIPRLVTKSVSQVNHCIKKGYTLNANLSK